MWAIFKKEVKNYFVTPIGYVFIGLFLAMCSIFFYLDVINYMSLQFENMFYSVATILTFIIPILTMRMFAEERKLGTEQLLFTSPISIQKIVIGKFLASLFIVVITEICTLFYLCILYFFGMPHIQTIIVTMLGFLMLSMAYISFGMFASSITENQIIAGVIAIGFFIITWFLPNFSEIFMPLSLIQMFDKFPQGIIAIEEIVTYITFTMFFIILTIIILQRKKKWLKDTTKTIILVLSLFVIFIGINVIIQKLDLTDIDITKNKLYTISESTVNQIKDIQEEIKIYLIGFEENTSLGDLVKQYTRKNNKIKYEIIDNIQERIDLKSKYGITDETQIIIVETQNKNKLITIDELYTYDYTTYSQIDLSEEKITNAIVDLTIEDKPQIYFLTGHGEYDIEKDMQILKIYLENEGNDIKTLDLLITKNIPEETKLLVISSPQKDFIETEKEEIIKYINNGGKILWMNEPTGAGTNYPNIQEILNLFGAKFDDGIILEQDSSKMVLSSPNYVIPEITITKATKNIATDGGILLINSCRISLEEDEKLEELNVTSDIILSVGKTALFRKEVSNGANNKIETDEEGSFILGVKLTKKINEENEAVIYMLANNLIVVDYPITIGNSQNYPIQFYNNKDYILNTIAELTNREDIISIRKDTGVITYTATEEQDKYIKIAITIFPSIIIIIGIIVWGIRKRKK